LPLEARLATSLAIALAVVYGATPLVIRVADRLQFYDKPVGYKGHGRPTPYLGGAAVMFGFLLALVVVASEDWRRTVPVAGGMAVLWGVGTIDDRRNLGPGIRVAVEALLAWVLWSRGLGWDLGVGDAVDLALTIAWVVGVVNAINLFDNMDGAASTMALIVAACVAILGAVHGDVWLAVVAGALCGACLGFLPHNLASPARIFLGDGGSMPVGFGVAALVMIGSAEAVPAWQALVVGLLLVGVPALDTSLVMVSRRRRGVSILTGGRDHLTHRAQRRLRTARAVAMALGAVQALVSALALFAIQGGASAILLIVVLYFVAAATAIALLEAEQREVVTPEGALVEGPPGRLRRLRSVPPAIAGLVAVGGIGAGASPFFSGYYEPGTWVPIGLGLLVVASAGAIARPPRLSRAAIIALLALGGLALWALLSALWAPSIEQATTEGDRTFVLLAILATIVILVRTDAAAGWLMAGIVGGIGVVAGYVIVHMLGPNPGGMFIGGRLDQPLGYINATGTVFVMGFWMCFSVVERRPAWLAGLGAGAATLMAGLALATQSRGVALAMIASLVVVLAFVPGDRLRRVFALVICGACVAATIPAFTDLYDVAQTGPVTGHVAHRAIVTLLVAASAAGLLWGAAVALRSQIVASRQSLAAAMRRAGVAAIAGVLVIVVGISLVSAGRIERTVSNQWSSFTTLSEGTGSASGSRLVSGSGTRYDYWRIAWDAFRDRPLAGVGAGNYDRPYFKARRTTEDVRQPHSLEMQTLSELGLVGALLLAGFLGAFVLGAWRMRSAALESPLTRSVMIAAVGAFTTWLVHTSVDWMHLMPGITAVAVVMGAVMLRDRDEADVVVAPPAAVPSAPMRAVRPRAVAGAVLAALALVLAAASLSRQGLSDYFADRASDALATRPLDALRQANQSLRLDAENPRTYYIKAAALARYNAAGAARRTLRQALAKEPDNFVTWTLLGDLSVRLGKFADAKRNYAHALALNPRDVTLQRLAKDPHRALQ
jgi:UDP-GlcNAc:undecaprenyl-phosphate/decaprenyl-phosphate GlcNAc-1-phosphate transferase